MSSAMSAKRFGMNRLSNRIPLPQIPENDESGSSSAANRFLTAPQTPDVVVQRSSLGKEIGRVV